jgi:hypothetical protein
MMRAWCYKQLGETDNVRNGHSVGLLERSDEYVDHLGGLS